MFRYLLSFVVAILTMPNAYSGFVITIGDTGGNSQALSTSTVLTTPGGSASVPIYGRFDSAASMSNYTVDSFGFVFDFGTAGRGYDTTTLGSFSSIKLESVLPNLSFTKANPPPAIANANWDVRFFGTLDAPREFSMDNQLIANLVFDIPTAASFGSIGVNMVTTPIAPPNTNYVGLVDSSNGNFAGTFGGEDSRGSISVVSGSVSVVPEPSSMALLSLLGVGGMAYRRFRGKKSA